jgi:hypothetical protein
MKVRVKRLALALSFVCGHASAIGLGSYDLQSYLGQPLRLVIDVINDDGGGVGCYRVIAGRNTGDGIAQLMQGDIRIEPGVGRVRLFVTSRRAIEEPVLRVTIEAGCETTVVRDYVLLLDPGGLPNTAPSTAVAARAVPASDSDARTERAAAAGEPRGGIAMGSAVAPASEKTAREEAPRKPKPPRSAAEKPPAPAARTPASGEPRLEVSKSQPPLGSVAASTTKPTLQAELAATRAMEEEVVVLEKRIAYLRESLARVQALAAQQAALQAGASAPTGAAPAPPATTPSAAPPVTIASTPPTAPGTTTGQAAAEKPAVEAKPAEAPAAATTPAGTSPPPQLANTEADNAGSGKQASAATGIIAGATQASILDSATFSKWLPWGLLVAVLTAMTGLLLWSRRQSLANPLPRYYKPVPVKREETTMGDLGATTIAPPTMTSETFGPRTEAGELPPWRRKEQSVQVTELTATDSEHVTEQANVYAKLGHHEQAIAVLREYVDQQGMVSPGPLLMLLDLYREGGNHAEYDRLSSQLKSQYNVRAPSWEEAAEDRQDSGDPGLEAFPHIVSKLVKLWGTRACLNYMQTLLVDTRGGTRVGFNLATYFDILFLMRILDEVLRNSDGNALSFDWSEVVHESANRASEV